MALYSTGFAERLLGISASTIRRWEREFGLVSPRRDAFGRRFFSESDILIMLRLRHLMKVRGLGFSNAREELLGELGLGSGGAALDEIRAGAAELRGKLVALYAESLEAARKFGIDEIPPPSS